MNHAETLIDGLRAKGFRITAARKAVIELLAKNTKPLGALDAHALLKKNKIAINPTTVYRELQFLAGRGILKTVQFQDGVQRYELSSLPHHHHFVCLTCNMVEDIHMDHELSAMEKNISKKKGISIERHSLEFYGRCGKCV